MSGGSFNYAYHSVENFAEELKSANDCNRFNPKTMEKLRGIEKLAVYTAKLMKEAEYLYSGDTGNDSFAERISIIELEGSDK